MDKSNTQSYFNELSQTIFDYSHDWLIILDTSFNIVKVNTEFLNEFDLFTNDIIGKSIYILLKELFIDFSADIEFLSRGNTQVVRTSTAHGQAFSWIIQQINTESASYFLLIGKFPSYREICNKYLQLETILEHMPCNVYWMDKDLTHLWCNQNVLKMCGVTKGQYVGSTYEDISKWANWPEGLSNSFKKDDLEVLTTGKSKLNVLEKSFITAEGHEVYLLTSRVPLKDNNGDIIGVGGISTDITELMQSKRKMEEMIQALDQANKAKSSFMANMSHDIRTPITGMIALIQKLYNTAPDTSFQENAKTLMDTTSELLSLLNDILETVKIESGDTKNKEVAFNLKDLLDKNRCIVQPLIEAKNLKLLVEFSQDCPNCFIGNKIFIKRILLNMIGNAIKFTEQGGIFIKIEVFKIKGKKITLKMIIKDTGIGMPEDKKKVIFEKFEKLSHSHEGKYDGHGLGLFIVKSYLNLMRGSVEVDSEVGKGSTFSFLLPFRIAPDQHLHEEKIEYIVESDKYFFKDQPTEERPRSLAPLTSRILVVEDSPLAAIMVTELLTTLGVNVVLSESGEDAIKQVEKTNFDLVFMDIGLPNIDGLEATKIIRASNNLPYAKKMPIIGLSAHTAGEYKVQCIEAGMNAMISKPLSPACAKDILSQYVPSFQTKFSEVKNKRRLTSRVEKKNISTKNKSLDSRDLAGMLINLLKKELILINQLYDEKKIIQLREKIHSLKGGASYCNVPKLYGTLAALNEVLVHESDDYQKMKHRFDDFNDAAKELIGAP